MSFQYILRFKKGIYYVYIFLIYVKKINVSLIQFHYLKTLLCIFYIISVLIMRIFLQFSINIIYFLYSGNNVKTNVASSYILIIIILIFIVRFIGQKCKYTILYYTILLMLMGCYRHCLHYDYRLYIIYIIYYPLKSVVVYFVLGVLGNINNCENRILWDGAGARRDSGQSHTRKRPEEILAIK